MNTMRAARLHGVGDVRLHEEAVPEPAPDESLVRVDAVGLCGSDLHWFDQGGIGDAVISTPVVPGHEVAGTALTGPYAGRLVAVDPAIPCESCPMCFEGHRNLCPTVRFSGHGSVDGGLREQMAWPTHLLTPLPDGLTAADGAVLEPLGVALHAWDLARPRVGASVGIVGCGPIGLLAIQLARVAGAGRIIASEPLEHRRQAALDLGADTVLTPEEAADPAAWQQDDGLGCEVVLEIAGSEDAVHAALVAARLGGRVLLAGIPDDDRTSFSAGLARRKGLDLRLVRRMKEMYERTTALAASGAVDVGSVVSETYPLAKTTQAFTDAASRTGLKVVVSPSGPLDGPVQTA